MKKNQYMIMLDLDKKGLENMLKKNMPLEDISDITGLSIEEIKKISNDNQVFFFIKLVIYLIINVRKRKKFDYSI